MLDNTMDVGQSGGAGGSPTQPVSTGDTPGSPGGVTLETALREVAELKAAVRSLQSEKDKGIAKVAKEVKSLTEQFGRYEQLKAQGYSPERIEREFELDALLAERRQSAVPQVPQAAGGGSPAPVANVTTDDTILRTLNLEPGSAEVTSILRAHPDDVNARKVAYAELVIRNAQAQSRPANPAQVMSAGGGSSPSVTSDSLTAEYQAMTKGIPPGEEGVRQRMDAKLAIRKKAAQAGVQSPV